MTHSHDKGRNMSSNMSDVAHHKPANVNENEDLYDTVIHQVTNHHYQKQHLFINMLIFSLVMGPDKM